MLRQWEDRESWVTDHWPSQFLWAALSMPRNMAGISGREILTHRPSSKMDLVDRTWLGPLTSAGSVVPKARQCGVAKGRAQVLRPLHCLVRALHPRLATLHSRQVPGIVRSDGTARRRAHPKAMPIKMLAGSAPRIVQVMFWGREIQLLRETEAPRRQRETQREIGRAAPARVPDVLQRGTNRLRKARHKAKEGACRGMHRWRIAIWTEAPAALYATLRIFRMI